MFKTQKTFVILGQNSSNFTFHNFNGHFILRSSTINKIYFFLKGQNVLKFSFNLRTVLLLNRHFQIDAHRN